MTGPTILDLTDVRAFDPAIVGHKAAGLARLHRLGFQVPGGLVLPVGAADPDGDPDGDGTSGAAVVLARQAREQWDGPLAVRSSTTWEDLATTARAGQSRTVLGVEDLQDVVGAVQECLAQDGEVAVLVQPLLAPSHAGVAFTADPVSGELGVVRLQAVEGLAESLLEGGTTGIDVTVRAAPGPVEGDLGTMPEADALAVARVARRVAVHFGHPVDVEWAVVDGEVHLLQARPITALPVPPTYPTGNGWQKDVAHYSEPLTPFGWWLSEQAATVVPEVFAEAGVIIDGLQEQLVGGQAYGRVIPAFGPVDGGTAPPPPAIVLGALARVIPALRSRTAAAARVVDGTLPDRWVQDWRTRRAGFVQLLRDLHRTDLAAMADEDLVGHLDRLTGHLVDGTRCHFRVVVPWAMHVHALHRRVADLPGWSVANTAALLTGASPPTSASEVAMAQLRAALAEVDGGADALRAEPRDPFGVLDRTAPPIALRLRDWVDEHGWRALNYDAGAAVLAEKPALVTRVLLAGPDPTVGQAGSLDDAGSTLADEVRSRLPQEDRTGFDAALARAREIYPLREDTGIVAGDALMGQARRWLLEAGARLVGRRVLGDVSDASYLTGGEVVDALAGRLGAEEAVARVVRRRGEEAWVRAHPGPLTIGHQGPPPSLAKVPAPLRTVNEAILWMVSLEYAGEPDATSDAGGEGAGAEVVRGVGVSPGVAEGPVRIVRDHRDLEGLAFGEVLVCQVASPGWVPAFPLCTAVVADGGGVLSHAAIAAREHGLPAVLGTARATATLHDGQVVRVDGTAGTVTVLDG